MQAALSSLGLGSLGQAPVRPCGSKDRMRVFGSRCVPKLYVYGGVGAAALLGLLVVLRRRRAA